ncbi:hypothetical protein [Candidatus Spongiihabitans sp.]
MTPIFVAHIEAKLTLFQRRHRLPIHHYLPIRHCPACSGQSSY